MATAKDMPSFPVINHLYEQKSSPISINAFVPADNEEILYTGDAIVLFDEVLTPLSEAETALFSSSLELKQIQEGYEKCKETKKQLGCLQQSLKLRSLSEKKEEYNSPRSPSDKTSLQLEKETNQKISDDIEVTINEIAILLNAKQRLGRALQILTRELGKADEGYQECEQAIKELEQKTLAPLKTKSLDDLSAIMKQQLYQLHNMFNAYLVVTQAKNYYSSNDREQGKQKSKEAEELLAEYAKADHHCWTIENVRALNSVQTNLWRQLAGATFWQNFFAAHEAAQKCSMATNSSQPCRFACLSGSLSQPSTPPTSLDRVTSQLNSKSGKENGTTLT